MARARVIGVIGAGSCDAQVAALAEEVGARLARAGCVVVCGGLGGVMEAASRGAAEAGGLVLGLLPGSEPDAANPWVSVAVATGVGEARNAQIINTAQAFVALPGSWGTLAEMSFAARLGKRVVTLGRDDGTPLAEVVVATATAEQAVDAVLAP